ncbi:hypothetical protein A2U01_0065327, partial [Trifolium medium]|nr:hypothetical protein [Trifolium medium]
KKERNVSAAAVSNPTTTLLPPHTGTVTAEHFFLAESSLSTGPLSRVAKIRRELP